MHAHVHPDAEDRSAAGSGRPVHGTAAGRDEPGRYKSDVQAPDCWAGSAFQDEEERARRETADASIARPYRVAAEPRDAPPAGRPDSVWRADAAVRLHPPEQQPREFPERQVPRDEERDALES